MNLDPNFMLQLLQVVVFVAQAAMAWYFLSGQSNKTTTQISPDPVNVQEKPAIATLAELRRLEERVHKLEGLLAEKIGEVIQKGEDRAVRINERIDTLVGGISDLRQDVGQLTGAVEAMAKKM